MRIQALLCLLFAVNVALAKVMDPKHSFAAPLNSRSSYISPFWDSSGNCVITDTYVRLTPAVNDKMGAVWNIEPCFMQNWEMEFDFKVTGSRGHGADGFAFWYVEKPEQVGPVFGYMDNFVGLGVIFDTFDNDDKGNNPYIAVALNDGTVSYDLDTDGSKAQSGGCISRFRNSAAPAKASVEYKDRVLSVYVDVSGSGKELCTRVGGVDLPTGYYFGFTAATGGLADNHDVFAATAFDLTSGKASMQRENMSMGMKSAPPIIDDDTPMSLREWLKQMREEEEERETGGRYQKEASPPEPSPATEAPQVVRNPFDKPSDSPSDPGQHVPSTDPEAYGRMESEIGSVMQSFSDKLMDLADKADLGKLADVVLDSCGKTGLSKDDIDDIREGFQDMKVFMSSKISNANQELNTILREIVLNVNLLREEVQKTKRTTDALGIKLGTHTQELRETVEEKKSSKSSWLIFILLQGAIVGVYTFVKKAMRSKRRKLI